MIAMDSAGRAALGQTVAEHVYAQIKADLLTGAFTPGAALLTRELLARYGCGISPLREALARLAGEGFWSRAAIAACVPLPSCADLEDIYRIRILLECEALELSMRHGDDHWEAAALGAFHRLERALLPGDGSKEDRTARATEWETRHRAFHSVLVAAAPAPRLLRLTEQMVEQTERYRVLRLMHSPSELLARDIGAEHRALLNATLAREPRATELLRDHLTRTWTFVADLFAQDSA